MLKGSCVLVLIQCKHFFKKKLTYYIALFNAYCASYTYPFNPSRNQIKYEQLGTKSISIQVCPSLGLNKCRQISYYLWLSHNMPIDQSRFVISAVQQDSKLSNSTQINQLAGQVLFNLKWYRLRKEIKQAIFIPNCPHR